jgi:hypothetical protein
MFRLIWAASFVLMAGAGQVIFRVPAPGVSCDTTLTSGGNVNTAITNAAGGDTICLDAGTYSINTTASKASTVTVKSTTGVSAVVTSLTVANVDNLTFDSLTITTLDVSGNGTSGLTVSNSVQTANSATSYWEVDCRDWTGTKTIVFDGNTHDDTSDAATVGGLEGRFNIGGGGGVSGDRANCGGLQIKNSTISGTAGSTICSDGIFLQAGNVLIGPGNHFLDMNQGSCGAHIDAIQCYDCEAGIVIYGNYFEDTTRAIGFYDSFDGVGGGFEITNNVFDNASGSPTDEMISIGGFEGMLVEHNTFFEMVFGVGTKTGDPANVDWIVQNNSWDNADFDDRGDQPGCGSNCIVRYNLLSNGGTIYRDDGNNVTGNASYVGTPRTFANWANWQLAASSPGENAGNDTFDMGTLCYGSC